MVKLGRRFMVRDHEVAGSNPARPIVITNCRTTEYEPVVSLNELKSTSNSFGGFDGSSDNIGIGTTPAVVPSRGLLYICLGWFQVVI